MGRLRGHMWALLALTGLSLAAAGPLLVSPSAATAQGGVGDDTLFLWWLAYVPHAVLHGGGLGFTEVLNAPRGVNVWWQTSVTGPALILAPVTVLAGSAAALNVLTICSFLLTSLATYALAFRLVRHRWGAFVAATLTGFGPYVSHHAPAHPNLAVWAVPPLLGLVGHELLVAQRPRWWALGLLLAFLVVVQFTLSTEVLATCALTALVVLVTAALVGRRHLRSRLRYAARAVAVAVVTATVVLALPLYYLLAGRQRLTGPAQQGIPRVRADLLSAVVPSPGELGRGWGLRALASPVGGGAEATAYLGLPLIAVAVFVVMRHRREPVVDVLAVTGLATWVLSLGSPLTVNGHGTGLPLPAAVLARLPLLRSVIPERFSAFTLLCVALLVGVGVAALMGDAGGRSMRAMLLSRSGIAVAVPVVISAALWPLGLPLSAHQLQTPRWFRDTAALRSLPPGSVLTVPLASSVNPQPMTWAAAADFRFSLVGGYVITPDERGNGTFRIAGPWPRLDAALTIGNPPDPTGPAGDEVRQAILRDHIGTVLVPTSNPRAPAIADWFARATLTTVRTQDDVLRVDPPRHWTG